MQLPKEFSIGEIAMFVGGKVQGPADTKVKSVALNPLTAGEGDFAFFFEPKFIEQIDNCKASAVMVPEGVETKIPSIAVKRPLVAVQKILSALAPRRYHTHENGIHPSAVVHPTAEIGENVSIGALVVIGPKTKIGNGTRIANGCLIGGEVVIGEKCLFHQGAKVADYVQIGNRVILQQGASIGADGFSYVTERPSNLELRMGGIHELSDESNPHLKIQNIGTVILEDDVEIGANSTVDRATMGATIVGQGTKVDNLVMIAHNCKIGKEALIVAGVGMAGSCTVGDRAVLAGQVGMKDHVKIGKDAIVQGQAGIMSDIPDKQVVCGSPAIPTREFFMNVANVRRLPKVINEFKALQRKVAELEAELQKSGRTLEATKK